MIILTVEDLKGKNEGGSAKPLGLNPNLWLLTINPDTIEGIFQSETMAAFASTELNIGKQYSSVDEIFAHELGHIQFTMTNKAEILKSDGTIDYKKYKTLRENPENEKYAQKIEMDQILFRRKR